ncbi:MAG TPA: hypothetical protein VH640_23650, partial [Bryobacteraceae bacterium]
PSDDFSRRFPNELPCRLTFKLRDGRTVSIEKHDYEGFTTNPPQWESALRKFETLAKPHTTSSLRKKIAEAVRNLEGIEVSQLTDLLAQVTPAALQQKEGVLYGR